MKEENSFEVKDHYPNLSLEEASDLVDNIAKEISVIPLPKKLRHAADLMESIAFKMMEQAETTRKNAKIIDVGFIKHFKTGGIK